MCKFICSLPWLLVLTRLSFYRTLSGVSELFLIPISVISAEVLCCLFGSTGTKGILECSHAGCLHRGQAGSLLGYQRKGMASPDGEGWLPA